MEQTYRNKISNKIRIFAGLVYSAIGGGLVYSSAGGLLSVGADSLTGSKDSNVTVIIFIIGLVLVALGIMSLLFLFSAVPGGKYGRT